MCAALGWKRLLRAGVGACYSCRQPMSAAKNETTSDVTGAQLRARLDEVRSRIDASARRAGRDAREVTLVAVSKTHPASLVAQAIRAGARDLGENKVQEAEEKIAEITRANDLRARWHL